MKGPACDLGRWGRRGCWLASLSLLLLAGCESQSPAARAGAAIDKAGTESGQAVGRAANATGGALERAGDWVRRRTE